MRNARVELNIKYIYEMDIDLKELHHLRKTNVKRNTKSYYINGYSLSIIETSSSYWCERQNSLLKYLCQNKSLFINKNILILFDRTGLCGIIISLLGGNTTIFDDGDYSTLIKTNIDFNLKENKPKIINIEDNHKIFYDYIIISETIYSNNQLFDKIFHLIETYSGLESKIILMIRKIFWEREMFLYGEDDKKECDVLSHFPKKFSRKQMTTLRSNENVVFELERKKLSWIETHQNTMT